jgi:hypothetical protein
LLPLARRDARRPADHHDAQGAIELRGRAAGERAMNRYLAYRFVPRLPTMRTGSAVGSFLAAKRRAVEGIGR